LLLKTTPLTPDGEWVGRKLTNVFDQDETVVMQAKHWKYFDWLAENGYDMDDWVKKADLARHKDTYTSSLGNELLMELFYHEKKRFLRDRSIKLFITPEGYD